MYVDSINNPAISHKGIQSSKRGGEMPVNGKNIKRQGTSCFSRQPIKLFLCFSFHHIVLCSLPDSSKNKCLLISSQYPHASFYTFFLLVLSLNSSSLLISFYSLFLFSIVLNSQEVLTFPLQQLSFHVIHTLHFIMHLFLLSLFHTF